MPGIQVEFMAIRNAAKVARALGWSDDSKVLAGLVRLWEHCCDTDSDQVDAAQLGGLFGLDQAALGLLVPQLVAFNFLDPRAAGWRICGAEKRIFRFKRLRRAGGMAAKANLIPGAMHRKNPAPTGAASAGDGLQPKVASAGDGPSLGSLVGGEGVVRGAAGDPGVEGEIPPMRASRARAASRPPLELVASPPAEPPDREWQELIDALVVAFAARRGGAVYDFGGRDATALRKMRKKHGAEAVRAAWDRALDHQGFPTVAFIYELEKNWNHFAGVKTAPAAETRQRAEAQNHDGDEPF